MRALSILAVAMIVLICILTVGATLAYAYYAQTLPSADLLEGRTEAQSTKIFDRNGEPLFEVYDSNNGRRTVVPISKIPLVLKQATLATEDPSFYSNPGVDARGILRAIYYLAVTGEPVSGGGSTITQQLVRNTLITAEPTIQRKIREAILAVEVTRRYPKDQILEFYLNVIPYGNLAYGIEAAAETYFNKPAQDLTLPEASLLAGLPQAPTAYNPCLDANAALSRQQDVLRLMIQAGYITQTEAVSAAVETTQLVKSDAFSKRCAQQAAIQAPHFVFYVLEQLEALYGPEVVYKGGLQVTTTLDMKMQRIAEDEARKQIAALAGKNVSNASLIALNPKTGEILTMLGSVDFFDKAIDGQVNVSIRLRQPGSSIKPINYVTAFEKGWTPATVIADVTTHFPIPGQPDYVPINYDEREHGLVPVRTALASSFNIPAVKTLQFVTVTAMIDTARQFGITTFKDASNYGLSLTLGGGDVELLELTGAYAVFADQGLRVPTTPFLKITDPTGKVLFDLKANPSKATQIVDARYAYQITSILSDANARAPAFGTGGVLKLTRPAAVKTGTTNDWRDNWTLGFTPDLVAGVWVGNSNNSEMEHISGVTGAGPLWHNFMERVLAGTPVQDFMIPPGMVRLEVCNESGLLPSELCPPDHRHQEIFLAEQAPSQLDNVWQKIKIDRTNGLLGSDLCPDRVDETIFAVYPPEARQWAIDHSIPQPPTQQSPNCPLPVGPTPVISGIKPALSIASPRDGSGLSGSIDINGTVQMANFDHYVIQIGFGNDPQDWIQLVQSPIAIQNGRLATWDTRHYPDGPYTIRLEMDDRSGQSFGGRVRVTVSNFPAPPPPPTVTPRPPTATRVPPTQTPLPTDTLTSSPPTATPRPPTATAVPSTATSIPPTATRVPPTATRVPPTATLPKPTATVATPTSTAAAPTATPKPTLSILTATATATASPSATTHP